jgi:hypothetical protein
LRDRVSVHSRFRAQGGQDARAPGASTLSWKAKSLNLEI